MKRPIALALLCAFLSSAFADVEFSKLDLGPGDKLLYTARADVPGNAPFDSLLLTEVAKGGATLLSFFPEEISLVDDGRRIQVQNRFGVYRTDAELRGLSPVPGFPSFARGSPVQSGKIMPCYSSPNGSYLLYIQSSSYAFGRLVLFDVEKGTELVVASDLEYSIEEFPAAWSPESRHFVYAKGGELFYFSIDHYKEGRVIEERFRRIGSGTANSVRWSRNGSLYYLKGLNLYRIMPSELFTQALYAGLIAVGNVIGKVPFAYDPNFDRFWVSPDGKKIILDKDGRNLFLFYLDPDDFGQGTRVAALPYLFLQGDTTVSQVVWPASDQITVFTGSIRGGSRKAGAYRFAVPREPSELSLAMSFSSLDVEGALALAISPDETRIALARDGGVSIRDYESWKELSFIERVGTMHALWLSDDEIVMAGRSLIERVTLKDGARNVVAIAQADEAGWAEDESGAIVAKASGQAFRHEPGSADWTRIETYAARPQANASKSYRVYLDALAAGPYRNTVMVRSVSGLGTQGLFPPPRRTYAVFPEKDDPPNGEIFDHGSRIRRREIALVFNAIDSAEGLTLVLNCLRDYGIKATFFVNGEFIARNPGAVKLIAESGMEAGSLFFTTADLTDDRWRIDADFVRRGLARVEDAYFSVTGRELSLLWHAPWYKVNSDILDAARDMNYLYVGRDIDPLDWVSREQARSAPGLYLPAHRIVEKIMAEKKPGSIVPIRIGSPEGGRDDYLFRQLSLLINALIEEGYQIVPVSTLVERTK